MVKYMFELIDASELCPEHKYKIIAEKIYTGIYKGECWHNNKTLIFDEVCRGCPRYFLKSCRFYRFISKKASIQSAMEQRALKLILCQVLGDPHFE